MSFSDQFQDFVQRENTCLIWGTECQDKHQETATITVLDSPRAGGSYTIDKDAIPELRQMYVEFDDTGTGDGHADKFRARLTTLLVRERQLGNDLPKITASTIAEAKSASRAQMDERLTNLLRFLIDNTANAGQPIGIADPEETQDWDYGPEHELAKRTGAFALSHSESTNAMEMEYLMDSLTARGFVEKGSQLQTGYSAYGSTGTGFLCRVTTDGYSVIESLQSERTLDQCFVAMWFNDKTNPLYDIAIAPAVEAAGYRPLRVDRQVNFLGKIDDQIIAEIRRSKFIIADFTHGEDGARGSVYYEAGFAHGLDIPVIFTCRKDQIDDLHFDTNHFLHLSWSADAPEELIEPLKSRIAANIGLGPHAADED